MFYPRKTYKYTTLLVEKNLTMSGNRSQLLLLVNMNLLRKLLVRQNSIIISRHHVAVCYSTERGLELRTKNYSIQSLSKMPHQSLVFRILRLQRLLDSYGLISDPVSVDGRDKVRVDHPEPNEIMMDSPGFRKIALKVLYLGWDYVGFSWDNTPWKNTVTGHTNTVMRVFLEAALRQQIITHIGSSKHLKLQQCGRTDRSVSGLSQVIALGVRSNLTEGYGVWNRKGNENNIMYDDNSKEVTATSTSTYLENGYSHSDTSLDAGEIQYVQLLNDALPPDIRVLAWAPVSRQFDARHNCKSRTYRYVFPRGNFDVDLMNEAAQKYVGTHDFRNFSTKSGDNLFKTFIREVLSFKVEELCHSKQHAECDMCSALITGTGFLNKQVRYMMSILGLIGSGKLPPDVIDDMLDVENNPRKPGYSCYQPINLTLVDSSYDDELIHWRWDQNALASTAEIMAEQYSHNAAKAEVLRHMYAEAHSKLSDKRMQNDAINAFTTSLSPKRDGFHEGFRWDQQSHTIEEKRHNSTKATVHKFMRRGLYGYAAELHNRHSTTEDNDG